MEQELCRLANEQYPARCRQVLDDARRVLENTFLFDAPWDMEQTQTPYRFAGEIDWAYQPAGDPEWTYMLARHGFVLHLAQACALCGDARFAQKAAALAEDFLRRVPILSVDTPFCRLSNWGVIGNAGLYQTALFLRNDAAEAEALPATAACLWIKTAGRRRLHGERSIGKAPQMQKIRICSGRLARADADLFSGPGFYGFRRAAAKRLLRRPHSL